MRLQRQEPGTRSIFIVLSLGYLESITEKEASVYTVLSRVLDWSIYRCIPVHTRHGYAGASSAPHTFIVFEVIN